MLSLNDDMMRLECLRLAIQGGSNVTTGAAQDNAEMLFRWVRGRKTEQDIIDLMSGKGQANEPR